MKQLLDLMEGSVSVSSEYGKGSTFHIEIPQEIVDDTPVGSLDLKTVPDKAPASQQNRLIASGLHILAVDDTPMNLMVVKKLLRDSGAVVETASGGTEALRKTLTTHYDLILMDHQMPGMDGITCLHRIREQESGMCRDSRVVCLTANVGADMETRYREAGFEFRGKRQVLPLSSALRPRSISSLGTQAYERGTGPLQARDQFPSRVISKLKSGAPR